MSRIIVLAGRIRVAPLVLMTAVCLFTFAAAAQAQPRQQPQQQPQGQKPPKKKLQASSNFAQYASRDTSNRLIAGGATRNITPEATKYEQAGQASFEAGKFDEAVEAFKKVVSLKPQSDHAHYNLGVAYEAAGRGAEAVASYRKATELTNDPGTKAFAFYNTGNIHAAAGRPKEAIEAYKRVVAIAPEAPEIHYNLGLAYAANGQSKEAVESFKQAVQLKPEYVDARFNLGTAYGTAEQYREAVEAFKEVVRLKPGHAEAHFNLGLAYLALDDRASAQAEIKTLQSLKPELAARLNEFAK